jgi:hypothetical protein
VPDYENNESGGKGGKDVKIDGTENPGVGTLSLELLPLKPSETICGWISVSGLESRNGVEKFISGVFAGGGNKWELKYGVLSGGVLTIHATPYRLNSALFTCGRSEVVKLEVEEKESEGAKRNRMTVESQEAAGQGGGAGAEARGETLVVKEMCLSVKSQKEGLRIKIPAGTAGWKADEAAWMWKLQQALSPK